MKSRGDETAELQEQNGQGAAEGGSTKRGREEGPIWKNGKMSRWDG